MTDSVPLVTPGDLLIGDYGSSHPSSPPEIVTVQRITPSGRIVLTEYPGQQYNPITSFKRDTWGSGSHRLGKEPGPSKVCVLQPDSDIEAIRAARQAWLDEQDALKQRRAQMARVRDLFSKLEKRWPYVYSNKTPTYPPYAQTTLDLLEQALQEMLDVTPEPQRR